MKIIIKLGAAFAVWCSALLAADQPQEKQAIIRWEVTETGGFIYSDPMPYKTAMSIYQHEVRTAPQEGRVIPLVLVEGSQEFNDAISERQG